VPCATAASANPSVSERRKHDNLPKWWRGLRNHLRLAVLLQPVDGTTRE